FTRCSPSSSPGCAGSRRMTDFAADRRSGSADVALGFLHALERWAEIDTSPTPPALRAALLAWLKESIAAQPTIALVHQLAARALAVTDAGLTRSAGIATLREELIRTADAERKDLTRAREALARQAAGVITERGGWIATLSMSTTVRDGILAVH